MHDEHKPLISRFPCYVEAEGRSEDREGIRHATCLARFFSREELELSHEASRAFSGDSLFDLTIGQCRRLPISSIRSSKK